MSHPSPSQTLIDRARDVSGRTPGLRLAVLFGSYAQGRERPDSDIDIGISCVDRDVPLSFELDVQAALEQATGRTVDLVRLDHASTLVRWQIATQGIPLYAAPHEWSRFRARAASEWGDFRPAFEAAAERFRLRLARTAG